MMWRAWMLLALLAGCASQPVTVDVAASRRIAIDSQRTTALAPGVSHRVLYAGAGPWVIQVLEATLDTCTTLRAIKGSDGAVGRERTSVMLTRLNDTITVLGGVNADFFLFTPPGVPTNAYITRRRVVTGPSAQPVFAIDPAGHPQIGTLSIRGEAVTAAGALLLSGWNRAVPSGLAVFDRTWGNQLDSATAVIEVVLSGDAARRVVLVDTLPAGATLPRGGLALVAGRNAPASMRTALRALAPGDRVDVEMRLSPFHPEEAVGGRPVLLEEGQPTLAALDTTAFARTRHPRTAVGIRSGGVQVMLVTVDGRQPEWSVGMSLAELADLMLDLGAHEAINLDGGGSTAMVVREGLQMADSLWPTILPMPVVSARWPTRWRWCGAVRYASAPSTVLSRRW